VREQYIEITPFLSPTFNKSEIKTHTALLSRTLLSLLSFLNGVYPELYEGLKDSPKNLLTPK